MAPTSVLVVDDEQLIRWSLVQRLKQLGLCGIEAADGREALERVPEAHAMILDYQLPDRSGFEVLAQVRRTRPALPIIMLTAHATVEHAVTAMKLGASHYVSKPFDVDEVVSLAESAARVLRSARDDRATAASLVGSSRAITEVRRLIARVAASPSSTVLLTGESGTGKDLAARAIHGESRRAAGPFVNVTCSAIPEHLLESELFGHERGAFTDARARRHGLIEQADGGTLFLDEIGEMPLSMQAKLLRFLEEKAFRRVGGSADVRPDVRVIAATNVRLERAVAEGTFREDLYYRLAVLNIELPPLRERVEDLPVLVERLLERLGAELGRSARISRDAIGLLSGRPWPGNVRELRNVLERALLLCEGDELGRGSFTPLRPPPEAAPFRLPAEGVDIEAMERALLVQALERAGGNQRLAGEMLGMNRDQVRYRMAKYGVVRLPRGGGEG